MSESPRSVTDDALDVAGELRVSVGMLLRKLRQAPQQGELSVPESLALSRLDRGGPATSSELARAERISPQSMGTTVAELERRGLVAREKDATDGRRIVLSITEAGRRLAHDRRGARTELIARALGDGFTPAELERLRAAAPLLRRLAERL
ncbi:MAG: MarR family transcriptional regulator [Nocardiopsaceae bacterium]|nr:MarR family transcriptional regulator [Nocardiopsaceae bacterium]